MNLLAELRLGAGQIENVDRKAALAKHRLGQRHQAPGLRHLAGTGVLAASRAVDDEDAWLPRGVVMPPLRRLDRLARPEPVDGDIVAGIGEAGPGLARQRRLA